MFFITNSSEFQEQQQFWQNKAHEYEGELQAFKNGIETYESTVQEMIVSLTCIFAYITHKS